MPAGAGQRQRRVMVALRLRVQVDRRVWWADTLGRCGRGVGGEWLRWWWSDGVQAQDAGAPRQRLGRVLSIPLRWLLLLLPGGRFLEVVQHRCRGLFDLELLLQQLVCLVLLDQLLLLLLGQILLGQVVGHILLRRLLLLLLKALLMLRDEGLLGQHVLQQLIGLLWQQLLKLELMLLGNTGMLALDHIQDG